VGTPDPLSGEVGSTFQYEMCQNVLKCGSKCDVHRTALGATSGGARLQNVAFRLYVECQSLYVECQPNVRNSAALGATSGGARLG
jgi:hypothetical protein